MFLQIIVISYPSLSKNDVGAYCAVNFRMFEKTACVRRKVPEVTFTCMNIPSRRIEQFKV